MSIKRIYSTLFEQDKVILKSLRSQASRLTWARFFSLLISGYAFYQYFDDGRWLYALASLLFLGLFIFLVARHLSLKAEIKFIKAYLTEVQMELDFLDGKLPDHDFAGQEFINPQHLYSHDLDLFGHHSLYHRINRCFSKPGETLLAGELAGLPTEGFKERQRWHEELSQKTDWMFRFRTTGRKDENVNELGPRLQQWLSQTVKRPFTLKPVILYLLALPALILLLNFALQPGSKSFFYLNIALVFNLIYTFRHFKIISGQYEGLSKVSKPLLILSKLVDLIEKEEFKSAYAQNLCNPIKGKTGQESSEALKSLSRIASAMDQINNVVVLIFLNGFFLYHLHNLNRLSKWREKYGERVLIWIKVVNQLEAEVSKATYVANHPHFNYPEIAPTPCFQTEGISHPLIAESKAISNTLDIENWRFAVLTGSNMSGKSTFLKTLGLSIVMARMGLPVFAEKLKVYPFKLLTSMKLVDSISKEVSYFQAEVLRLKSIKEEIGTGNTSFLLLDEILRGTNSDDKRSGTRQFMQGLAKSEAWGFVATHDTDIADLSESKAEVFKALYFESKVEQGKLLFDYRLREGVCATPNATRLMQDYGII